MPDTTAPRTPRAFLISVVFGSIGFILLLIGVVLAEDALTLSGVAAGCLSLISALVWREELIVAWNAQRRKRSGQP